MGRSANFFFKPDFEYLHLMDNECQSVCDYLEELDDLAKEGGVTSLGELGLLDEDRDLSVKDDREYFRAAEGMATIEYLLGALKSPPADRKKRTKLAKIVDSIDASVVSELEQLLGILRLAAKRKAKFRLAEW